MQVLYGKCVAENIAKTFEERINKLKEDWKIPHIAVLGISGDEASEVYIRKIEKNCNKYGIKFTLKMADTNREFIKNFEEIKKDESITGVMFQEPLSENLLELIDEISYKKDIEGIGTTNMGKLFLGKQDAFIPCTSKAVIELIDYYNIDLQGKKVVIVGRSNIVGKPLIMQLLERNATVEICHSKTEDIQKETLQADIVIMAVGKAKFLKRDYIKNGAILIDVGINFEDGKMVGDIDYEDIQEKASMCTPVPGGIGAITNAVLIDNIIKSCE